MYSQNDELIYQMIAGIGITFYVIGLALGIFMLVCQWKMYVKAGESGWATIIPFYSNYVMFKIAVGNGWKMFFMLIPLFNIGYAFYALYKLGKAYGYGFGMFLLLLFLPVIGLAILGLGKAEYIGCE